MFQIYLFLSFLVFHTNFCQTTDKYTDENRPYKFGFNIEGYQHRQEQKNEKGLIKGEYGFITADGYYRVTVYATDENGDFKILSMKNYYVGFPPENPTTTSLPTPKSKPLITSPPTTTKKSTTLLPYVKPTGVPGCSDCWIPTKQPPTEDQRNLQVSQGLNPKGNSIGRNDLAQRQKIKNITLKGLPQSLRIPKEQISVNRRQFDLQSLKDNHIQQFHSGRPEIGEVRDGLPPGVSVGDIMALLYKFNYTVGFHGHHEKGYRNGNKEGGYFFDGRDGTERQVKYIANEFGYQPNITVFDLPENDVRIPNELTEKKYGLKGYEFKWFYRK